MSNSQSVEPQPRPLRQGGYGTEQCLQCKVWFPTFEKLMEHKREKYVVGKSHIHCEDCGQDFRTERARLIHGHQMHPKSQYIKCPGCRKGPFQRASALISHIENGKCTRISSLQLTDARNKKLEFIYQLKAITKEPVKMDFTSCLPMSESQALAEAAAAAKEWNCEPQVEPTLFRDDDFPALPGSQPQRNPYALPPGDNSGAAMTEQKVAMDFWGDGGSKLSNTAAAQSPTAEQLRIATAPNAREVHDAQDLHDPSHDGFNVSRYINEYTGRYDCPRAYCFKAFKTHHQIIAHLRSPVHASINFDCPYCRSRFHSVTNMLEHAEATYAKCCLRNTDGFGAFVSQLTGGIINVSRSELSDGTPKFEVSEEAMEAFGNRKKTHG